MNDINNIVFEVYKGLLESDYSRNIHLKMAEKIRKMFRYLISGYFLEVRRNRIEMNKINEFIPTHKIYLDSKIVIYTVSTGKYDDIKEPIYVDDKIDYFVFTDQNIKKDSIWKKIEIPVYLKKMTSLEQARYIKTHPHEFFTDYDISMFIDGNIRITCNVRPLFYTLLSSDQIIAIHHHQTRDCIYDEAKAIYAVGKAPFAILKKQIKKYKKEGFPAHYGLFETNIVIRKHMNEDCIRIMNSWWNEMACWTKRDQLSFTYALWKNKFLADYVLTLGNNSRKNPYFLVDGHK